MSTTTSSIDTFIAKLDRGGYDPKPTGPASYEAHCPGHGGRRRNLSIRAADDGTILLKCHHEPSCPVETILAPLGLELRDLFPESDKFKVNGRAGSAKPGPKKPGKAHRTAPDAIDAAVWGKRQSGDESWKCAARWSYPDDYIVARLQNAAGEKSYVPVHRRGTGWHVGDPEGPLPLYRRDELADAPVIWLFEGEKCADLARDLGMVTTTTAHGAGSPHRSDLTPLVGKTLHLMPDHDQEGETYVGKLATLASKLDPPPRIKIVRLPLSEKGDDIEQWLESLPPEWDAGRRRRELERLAADTPEWVDAGGEKSGSGGGFVGFVSDPPGVSPEFEGDPRPIAAELLPVPPLDPAMIPGTLRPWLIDIAERGCFPLEYGTVAALVGLASLVGRKVAIRPKRNDAGWTVTPNLWGAVVGPPGVQKSPAVEEALRPLRRLAGDAIAHHEEAVIAYKRDKAVWEARSKAAKERLEKASKRGASDEEMHLLAAEMLAPKDLAEPTARRYLVNDTTVEKLGELLKENPNGLLYFRDELTGLFRSMDRAGHESDRALYLESWAGNGSFTYDRIGRGTIFVPHLCLSIFGTIQPGPLARYLRGAASGEDADGFMPRFQVLVYPDAAPAFVNVDRTPNVTARDQAYAVFRDLDALDTGALGCCFGCPIGADGVPYLGFTGDAQILFDEWRTDLENRLRSGKEGALLTNHLAKYRSLMPSLAGLFHFVDTRVRPDAGPISLSATEAAAAWCDLLEQHARRVYQSALDGDPENAQRLAQRIKASLPNPFTYRDVARKGWSGLSTVEDVRHAVGILEDRNWVRVVERPATDRGGRPTEDIWIHPKLAPSDKEGRP